MSSESAPGRGSDVSSSAEDEKHTTTKVVMISVVAAIGGFLFGFDTSVVNGAVDAITDQFALSKALSGFAVSCALLGAAVGAWFAGRIADRFGRKAVMVVGGVLFAIGAVGSAFAFNVWDLIAWRVVGGLGSGRLRHRADLHRRGRPRAHPRPARLAAAARHHVGIFAALLSDAFIANTAGSASEETWLGWEAWRWMFLVGVVPSVVWAFLALQVPESPRYLIAKGETQRAGEVLREVLGTRSLEAVQRKVTEIKNSMRREHDPSLRDLRGPKFGLLPVVWVGILLSVLQQGVGINVIFYYSTTLWQAVGFQESDALTTSVITSVTNVVVTFIAIATVDKIGRKPLLTIGSAGMFVSLTVMAIAFSQAGAPPTTRPCRPVGTHRGRRGQRLRHLVRGDVGPVVWVLLGEMFPNKIRAAGLAVAAAAQWLANFAISTSFPAWPASGCSSPTASTPSSRCCRSSSSARRCGRRRAANSRTWTRTRRRRRGDDVVTLHLDHAEGRDALLDELAEWERLLGAFDDLDAPSRCAGWTCGQVLAHVHLGLQDVALALLAVEGPGELTVDAAGYWTRYPTASDPAPDRRSWRVWWPPTRVRPPSRPTWPGPSAGWPAGWNGPPRAGSCSRT